MSRLAIYGFFLQCVFFSIILAKEGKAQKISIEDVYVNISANNTNLKEVFADLSRKTGFGFSFSRNDINKKTKVNIKMNNSSLADVLRDISKETGLQFKRVNNNIYVKKNLIYNKAVTEEIDNKFLNQKKITGTVTSADNAEPLPGVSILIKGTSSGTTTDLNGKFALEAPEGTTLQFSFIGYETQEVVIGTQTVLEISMLADLEQLEEVVVVGYGTQKKATVSGSISTVKGEEIASSPSANVSNSLAGRLPGLTVNQRSGEPGRDDPQMFIRGMGTTGDNSILIIIDGVVRDGMSRLNPDDIESFTVLKDASAAIYGARAANGVMLITTKKGKLGKPEFDFSYNYAMNRPTKTWELLDAPLFAQVMNEGAWYRAGRPDLTTWTPQYTEEDIQKIASGSDPLTHPNTDWIAETLKPWAIQNRTNFSVRGGTEKVNYFVSFAALGQNGNYYNNKTQYNQYNIRSNIELSLNENLTVGVNLSGRYDKGVYSQGGAWIDHVNILLADPTITAVYPNGLIAGGRAGSNPLLNDQMGEQTYEHNPIFTTFTAEYKIPGVEGLRLSGSFNYDIANGQTKTFRTPYTFWTYDTNTDDYYESEGGINIVSLEDFYEKRTGLVYNLKADYATTINKNHTVALMLGTERQQNKYNWARASNQNFLSASIPQINVGSSSTADRNAQGSAEESAYVTYFGRFNYNFKEKYLLEVIARYDGSQNFPKETTLWFFPGVSGAWRLSEENFLKGISTISDLKIRASYGEIGNDRVPAYQYLQAYGFGSNYVFGGSDYPGINAGTMPNPNITWEVSKKTDLGLVTELWNGLLGVDLTLFWENRSNILEQRNVSVSKVFGFSTLPDENIGEVENKGYELVLSHNNRAGDFTYNVTGNVAFARNKVVFIDEVPYDEGNEHLAATGKPVNAGLYWQADGIINTQEELDGYLPLRSNAQVGDTKLIDVNGDGTINNDDRVRSNLTNIPEYVFGVSFNAQYKNFDFNMFWQGATGVENYDPRFMRIGRANRENGFAARAENRWTVDNPNGTWPRADGGAPRNNTLFVFDASFIRLKTIELGYSLPQEWMSKANLSNVRFYVSGFNLLTFTKHDWIDPETAGQFVYYPQQKTLNFGVNVQF